jgi:hypothetical protein
MASGPPRLMPMVEPSGSALATTSVPVLPEAPGLFSTMKLMPGWRACRSSARSRPTMSGVEPGANGTMIRTGFVGQSCPACPAGCAASGAAAASSRARVAEHRDCARKGNRREYADGD